MELNLPLDFERLPEYRMLLNALRVRSAECGMRNAEEKIPGQATPPPGIEGMATHIWMRLWVELGYLAQTTNRPGLLTEQGAKLFAGSLEPMFGDECGPVKLLVEAGCLSEAVPPGFHFCERFAKLNGHMAGDFKVKEKRGAAVSEVVRSQRRIAQEAVHQGMLLPSEMFRRGDGAAMDSAEVNRCMVVIKTLDNCLKAHSRTQGDYSETIIMDAGAAAGAHSQEELRDFYAWLILHRDNPMVPKTAEQILGDFERVFGMAK